MSPTDAGQTVTFEACGPCGNFKTAAHLTGFSGWPDPPANVTGNPFLIDLPGVTKGMYIQFSHPAPPADPVETLYLTNNFGVPGSWILVTSIRDGNLRPLELAGRPYVAGPAANLTIYQGVTKPGGRIGLIKITGIDVGNPATAVVSPADNGLNSIGRYWGGFVFPAVFGVDPNNAKHLIAADAGSNKMMFSIDGGDSWQVDAALTNLVTGNDQFLFSQPHFPYYYGLQVHVIEFDPFDDNRILVGTEAAGIIFSLDGGQTWDTVPGSGQVSNITSFFFRDVLASVLIPQPLLVSSYGRGLWEVSLPTGVGHLSPITSASFFRQAAAQDRPRPQAVAPPPDAPYLRLAGTLPITGQTTALTGDTVSAYGSGFCGAGCSPVTLTVGDRVAVEQVPVVSDGTFRINFTVTENPGLYTVTALQSAADGSTLTDSAVLVVPVSDSREPPLR
jgi:hypothetical protein